MTEVDPYASLTAEYDRIHKAVSAMTLIWASVENSLAELLAQVINDETKEVSSAIFFAPSSPEARIAIADAAFRALLPNLPDKEKIADAWEKTVKRLYKHKTTRNRVAHGQVSTISDQGKNYVRLTAALFDRARMLRVDEAQNRDASKVGLSAHQLEQSIQAVTEVVWKVQSFTSVVRLWRENDVTAYPLVVQGLAN